MVRRAKENVKSLGTRIIGGFKCSEPNLGPLKSSKYYLPLSHHHSILLFDCFKDLPRDIGIGLFCLHTRAGVEDPNVPVGSVGKRLQ